MMKSKNFSFYFAKDISKFMILEKDIWEVRSFYELYRVGLNVQRAKIKLKFARCYDSKTLELIYKRNLVLELTQENLMEFQVQCIYLYIYILTTVGPCSTISSLPWRPYISHEINIYNIYCMTLLLLNVLLCSTIHHMIMWLLLWPMCDSVIMTSL